MEQQTLSLAHYEAVRLTHGAEAAVDAIRADIARMAGRPIDIEMRGPNHLGEMVAELSFVRAAAWSDNGKGFRVNLLTMGFSVNPAMVIDNLFNALTNPSVPKKITPDKLDDPEHDEPEHAPQEEVIGLIVGSHAHPDAFLKFER